MTLKEVLGEELYTQVNEKIEAKNASEPDKTKHVQFVDLSEGNYVARGKYDGKVSDLSQQVKDLQAQITQRDTDMEDLKGKLTAAQTDSSKLSEAQTALTDLQSKYDTDKKDWESKINQQAYEYRVRERANGLQFSSNAARSEFVRSAIAKQFQTEGDTLLGFDDYVTAYKEKDPGAFVQEKPSEPTPTPEPKPTPTIVAGTTGKQPAPDSKGFGFHFNGVRAKPQE